MPSSFRTELIYYLLDMYPAFCPTQSTSREWFSILLGYRIPSFHICCLTNSPNHKLANIHRNSGAKMATTISTGTGKQIEVCCMEKLQEYLSEEWSRPYNEDSHFCPGYFTSTDGFAGWLCHPHRG